MQEFTGPCPCGKGKLEIERCTPDHGYSVSVPLWYETSVQCAVCRTTYDLERFGKAFNLVAKAELAQIEAKRKETTKVATKLAEDAKAKGVMSDLAKLLDSQKSVAAVYRIAAQAGLAYCALPSFRKSWTEGAALIGALGSGYKVGEMLKVLQIDDAELQSAVEHLEILLAEGRAKPTPIQPPVYTLT
jgi:hypothetical protein